MQMIADNEHIQKSFDKLKALWIDSEHFRIFGLIIMLYLSGYFGVGIWIPALVGFFMIRSHREQLDVEHKRLQARYVHYDKDPQLVRLFMANIPKWIQHGEWEKCRWFNNMLEILWPHFKVATEASIRESLGPMLHDAKPGFLSKLELDRVDLGDTPIRVEAIKVIHMDDAVDEVILDLQINMSGRDASIAISAGNKVVSILAELKYIEIRGTLRIVLWRLFSEFPLFNAIRVAFTEEPVLKYRLTAGKVPLSNIPGFEKFLDDLIQDSLSESMVWPNEVIMHMDDNGTGALTGIKHPKGVLTVRVIEAKNLQNKDLFGKSDPMATVWISMPKMKTRTKKSTLNPVWDEVFEFTVYDKVGENLHVAIENCNFLEQNDSLGDITIDLNQLKPRVTHTQWYKLKHIRSGSVHIELFYRPFIRKMSSSQTQNVVSTPSTDKVTFSKANSLNSNNPKDVLPPYLSPDRVKSGNNRIAKKDAASRSISRSFALAIGQTPSDSDSDWERDDDEDDGGQNTFSPSPFASKPMSLNDLSDTIINPNATNKALTSPGPRDPRVSFRKLPKIDNVPNNLRENKNSDRSTNDAERRLTSDKIKAKFKMLVPHDKGSPPVERTFDAILRLKVVSASNLKAENRNGTSDPFVWIKLGDRRLKTSTKKKTCNPVWNEEFQIKLQADEIQRGVLGFTVKDYDKWTKNTGLGKLQISIKDIMTTNQVIHQQYRLESTTKGTLTLEMEILSVYSASEIETKSSLGDSTLKKSISNLSISTTDPSVQ